MRLQCQYCLTYLHYTNTIFVSHIIIAIIIMLLLFLLSLVTGLFSRDTALELQLIPTARLQVSDCSTSSITCAVCCSETTEWFPGMSYKFFFEPVVTIPVDPVITGVIIRFWIQLLPV